jgi:hypothetical protein
VDFGSHTTRAGYAGEDTPRVVCPSFYGYTDESSSSTTGEDVEMNGNTNGDANGGKGKGKRKYYVGEDGVGIWRAGMEVGNFVSDGVGMCSSVSDERGRLMGSDGGRTCCAVTEPYPTSTTRS